MKIKTSLKRRIFALLACVTIFMSFMVFGVSATNDINSNAIYVETNFYNSDYETVDIDGVITPDNLGQILGSDEFDFDGFEISYTFDTVKNDYLFIYQNNSTISTSNSGKISIGYTLSNFEIKRNGEFKSFDDVTIDGSGWVGSYIIMIECHDPSTGAVYNDAILPEDGWFGIGAVITANDVFRTFNVEGDVIVVDKYSVYYEVFLEDYDLKDVVSFNSVTFDSDAFLGVDDSDNSPTKIEYIFTVFTTICYWLITATNNITPMFYGVNGLTFVGCLSVCGLAISVFLLMTFVIDKFLGGGG